MAIAEGRLVELPTDPVARAIIAADRKARGEAEPGTNRYDDISTNRTSAGAA